MTKRLECNCGCHITAKFMGLNTSPCFECLNFHKKQDEVLT